MKAADALKLHKRLIDAFPMARSLAVGGNADEWRGWFQALPFEDASRALTLLIAGSDFPTIHQFLSACGFDCGPEKPGGPMKLTPAVAMLQSARDGGYELVRDPQSPHGWRSSMDALPEPEHERTPMPEDVRASIREKLARLAAKKVPEIDVAKNAGDRAALEAELAMADAQFQAELARAQAAERGELELEDLIPH